MGLLLLVGVVVMGMIAKNLSVRAWQTLRFGSLTSKPKLGLRIVLYDKLIKLKSSNGFR